jgi:hypothetical protein
MTLMYAKLTEILYVLFQGGEDWKRKLVQPPNHFDGSFVDADLQRFRPEPIPSPNEDPWYASRLVDKRTSGPVNNTPAIMPHLSRSRKWTFSVRTTHHLELELII